MIVLALLIAERTFGIVGLHRDNLAAVEKQVLDATDQAVGQYRTTLAATLATLTTLAADPAGIADGRTCSNLSRVVETIGVLGSLSILDTNGAVTCSSSGNALGLDLSGRDYFQIAMRGVGSLSTVSHRLVANTPAIFAAEPVNSEEGDVIAVLVGRIELGELFPNSITGELNAASQVILVDPNGVVILNYPETVNLVGTNLNGTQAVAQAMSRTRGTIAATGPDGRPRIYGFMRLPSSNMHLLVGVDEASVTEPVRNATWRAAATLLSASLIIFLGIWLAGEKLIIAPVLQLSERLARFGRGEDHSGNGGPVIAELQPLVAAFEAMTGELTHRESALRTANQRLRSLASLDPLTGIANRRSFDAVLALQWSSAPMIAMLMIDIDHFKRFNDHYGHGAGDDCIRRVAQTIAGTVRGTDIVARVGGEEFAVLMPGADIGPATEVAERIRLAVEQLAIPHTTSSSLVSVSVGCAAAHPGPDNASADLLVAADRALYAAKEAGRNAVRTALPAASPDIPPNAMP